MKQYKYLIVGGGMTADMAVRGILSVDKSGSIGLISEEQYPPYDRPPLSKGLWTGDTSLDEIWRNTAETEVDLHLGRQVYTLDAVDRYVIDDHGVRYGFDKLLLATGGRPRRLLFDDDEIIYFRTVEDYEALQTLVDERQRFGVIGAGFIGSEIAAALRMVEKEVVMLFPEHGIGGLSLPPDLAEFLNKYYRDKGVEVLPNCKIIDITRSGQHHVLQTETHGEIVVDAVVAGIGLQPNVNLAEQAGLEVSERGILVDQSLRTSHPDIYAAGDVAVFYNPLLDERIRVEHEDNANAMGRLAGKAMAGEAVSYDYLPFFYSDLFDLGYEAVGQLNPDLDIVADWAEKYQKGIIYYLQQGRVRGIILWNVWGQVEAARQVIGRGEVLKPEQVKGQVLIT